MGCVEATALMLLACRAWSPVMLNNARVTRGSLLGCVQEAPSRTFVWQLTMGATGCWSVEAIRAASTTSA